jgi:hypothetical protein
MRTAILLSAIAAAAALVIAVPTAHADQFQWNDMATAKKGAAVLQKGRRVIHFCEPCKGGHREAPVEIRSTTKVRRAKSSTTYWEVIVDGKAVDLAYVFVEVAEGSNTFDNVALAIGAPASGVSARLTE